MKKTIFVLAALAFVIAAIAGGSAFILRQKQLGELHRLTRQAEDKLNSRTYDQAISMLKKVEADGGTDRSVYLLGKAFYEQGKTADGVRYFEELLKQYPKSSLVADARLFLGREALKAKDTARANMQFLRILADHPKSAASEFALVELARLSLDKKDTATARRTLETVMRKPNSPARSDAEFLIGDLNMEQLKSPDAAPGEELYTIKSGDTIYKLERVHKVPGDLLVGINGLNPNALSIGRQIRIPRLNIAVVVDKTERVLTVRNGTEFLKKYRVGVARSNDELPSTEYAVRTKHAKGLEWADSTGKTVKAGDAENPYGSRYIELRKGVGIHGTNDPEVVGKLLSEGTVAMTNQDVEELYALVQTKTPVLVKGQAGAEASPGNK